MSCHRVLTPVVAALLLSLSTLQRADAASSVGPVQWVVPVTGAAIVLAAVLRHRLVGEQQSMDKEFEKGRRWLKTGDYDSAVQVLARAVDIYENRTSPRMQRRKDLQRLYRDAKRYLAKARELLATVRRTRATKGRVAGGGDAPDSAQSPPADAARYPSPFEQDGQWGYRFADGRVVIEPRFAMAQPFTRGGIAAAVDDSGWVYVDTNGTPVIRPHAVDNGPDYFAEGCARFVRDGLFGYFDTTGAVVIEPSFDFAQSFSGGYAAVCTGCSLRVVDEHTEVAGGLWGLIDRDGAVVVPMEHERVRNTGGTPRGLRDGEWVPLTVSGASPATDDTIRVHRDEELSEIQLFVSEGSDSLAWQLSTTDANHGVVSARWPCSLSWETHVRLALRLLDRLLADTAELGTPHTLFLGRLNPCGDAVPVPAQRLARAALQSPDWDSAAGTARSGHVNELVVSLANEHNILAELCDVFETRGLTLRVSAVEKVLIGDLSSAGLTRQQTDAGAAKVPFDCMLWFAVERQSSSSAPPQ